MNKYIQQVKDFAIQAHGEQKRKYTGVPYWHHLEEVAVLVDQHGGTDNMIMAAWLHDTVEDTGVTIETIVDTFGLAIADMVAGLTDISKPTDGNRAVRKAIDRAHMARASKQAKIIKLADIISNTVDIRQHDPEFAKVYIPEKKLLLEHLVATNPGLFALACKHVYDS